MNHEELTPLLKTTIKDRYRLVYWIYFLFGIVMLLPWNVFITASEYFAIRFAETPYKENFQNYFSTYFTLSNLSTYVAVLYTQNKYSYKFSPFKSILLNTTIFGILAISTKTEMDGTNYFYYTMLFIILTSGSTSFFQNAVFSEASHLPPIYTQAVLCGQGLAGVVVAFSSISSMFIEQDSARDMSTAAFLYFISAFLMTLTALVGRLVVVRLPFYRHHIHPHIDDVECTVKIRESKDDTTAQLLLAVVQKMRGLIFSVSYVFIVTIVVFPSITALIKSSHRSMEDTVFVAFHFVVFNVGDWVGRILPMCACFRVLKVKSLILLATLRTVFIPLFLVCHIVVSEPRHFPALIQSDVVYFSLLGLFAVTNGWLCSLCMMAAPQLKSIKTASEKSMAGSVMSFSLVAGLAVGGSLSFLAKWVM